MGWWGQEGRGGRVGGSRGGRVKGYGVVEVKGRGGEGQGVGVVGSREYGVVGSKG